MSKPKTYFEKKWEEFKDKRERKEAETIIYSFPECYCEKVESGECHWSRHPYLIKGKVIEACRIMANSPLDNPFYSNHVFSKCDLSRAKIGRWTRLALSFLPTYVQLSEGHVFYYKRWRGRYYLIKEEFTEKDTYGTKHT